MEAKVVRHNGVLKIDIDGKIYNPLGFKSFRPNPQNVSEFYGAGVRLFCVLTTGVTSALGVPYSLYGESWVGENEYDFSSIDRQMDMFIKNAPDAYFAPMIQLDTREWYLKLHPDKPNSFTHLSQIACDEEWRQDAANYLKAVISHIEEKYHDKVYGYFLLCGTTTEWLSHGDLERSHPIKERGYKKWCDDENAVLPLYEHLNSDGDVFLSESEEDVYKARKFHAEIIADLILYFTKEAQSVIKHNKLLGLYYGYLLELGGERLYNDGSLGYEKVFLNDDIDIISSPSSYCFRQQKDPSAFMLTSKTLDAHNKLYFLEFDHITHSAPDEIHENYDESSENAMIVKIPGAESKCKNETESLNLLYRDFLLCTSNMTALWWFDMFDGWFRSESMMKAIKQMIQIGTELSKNRTESVADVAVFFEGESMYRVRKSSKLASIALSDIRRTLAGCGAAYDMYSISDLSFESIDKYKVYMFVNQYDITEENKKRIEEKCKCANKTVIWLYAPDYALDKNVENVFKMTGIKVLESKISYDENITNYNVKPPYFEVDDKDTIPIEYFEDGKVAVAYKEIRGVKNVYAATPCISSSVLREILKIAGVFIYSENENVYTYANSNTLGVFNATKNDVVINAEKDGIYEDLISKELFICEKGKIILPKKEINAFLLKKKG